MKRGVKIERGIQSWIRKYEIPNPEYILNDEQKETKIYQHYIPILPREIVQTQVPYGFEPNGSFFVFWVQTQRSLFRSSGFEPRGLKNLMLSSDLEVTI